MSRWTDRPGHLPGVCIVCRADVVWNGKRWRNPGQRSGRHVCPADRPTCGAWMPIARERCARGPGHSGVDQHRSAYALDNARRMASARANGDAWDGGSHAP